MGEGGGGGGGGLTDEIRRDKKENINNKGEGAIKFLFPFELTFAQLKCP